MQDLKWFLRRYWRLIALAVIPGYLFWRNQSTRADMLIELWASCVLGLVVWIMLGWRGNPVLRRFNLRSDAPYLTPHVRHMLTGASYVLKDFVRVSTQGLTEGKTLSVRKQASDEIRRKLRPDPPRPVPPDMEEIHYLESYWRYVAAEGSHEVLSGLADLQASSHSFCGACRTILQIAEMSPEGLPSGVPLLLEAALDLCDTCNSILAEAGVLVEG